MTEVLVLVDHVDGKVTKPTLELLTIARRLGEPSAVVIGGDAAARPRRSRSTAPRRSTSSTTPTIKGYLVAPKAEVLAQLVEKTLARPRC